MSDNPSGHDDVSTTVVEAVSEGLGLDPMTLNPRLADVIDPDALDALVASREDGTIPPVTVTFEFHGQTVTVDARDGVTVRTAER